MPTTSPRSSPCRVAAAVIGAVVALAWGGCASQRMPDGAAMRPITAGLSPVAESVAPREAWRLAEAYALTHPGSEVLVGSGDSMLPLYHDRTVLVVEHLAMSELRAGMTVIFIGERGRPVAHTLFEKTPRGWRTIGLGNREPDTGTVRYANYIGTVVKAFAPMMPVALGSVALAAD